MLQGNIKYSRLEQNFNIFVDDEISCRTRIYKQSTFTADLKLRLYIIELRYYRCLTLDVRRMLLVTVLLLIPRVNLNLRSFTVPHQIMP